MRMLCLLALCLFVIVGCGPNESSQNKDEKPTQNVLTTKQTFEQHVDYLFDQDWQGACDLMTENAQQGVISRAGKIEGQKPTTCAEAFDLLSQAESPENSPLALFVIKTRVQDIEQKDGKALVTYNARLVTGDEKIGKVKLIREDVWLIDEELKLQYTVRELKDSVASSSEK